MRHEAERRWLPPGAQRAAFLAAIAIAAVTDTARALLASLLAPACAGRRRALWVRRSLRACSWRSPRVRCGRVDAP
jgi:hypothetical protein